VNENDTKTKELTEKLYDLATTSAYTNGQVLDALLINLGLHLSDAYCENAGWVEDFIAELPIQIRSIIEFEINNKRHYSEH